MFSTEDVMSYEAVSDNMTWTEFKNTNLYKLYLKYSLHPALANIKSNVDDVMRGKISDTMMHRYGFVMHDIHAPFKLYQYLRVSLKRISKTP